MAFFGLFYPDYNDAVRGYEYLYFGTVDKLAAEESREEHPTRNRNHNI